MGYDIFLFRKEVKEQNSDLEFLENVDLVTPFTDEQFDKLKARLIRYGYQIENELPNEIRFNFKGGKFGIIATLSKRQLSFSSGFDQNGVAEISLTASEFTDSGDFRKLDPQDGGWEEII
jgi:hypothetical protein